MGGGVTQYGLLDDTSSVRCIDEEIVAGFGLGASVLAGLLPLSSVLLGIVGEDEYHTGGEAAPKEGGEGCVN